MSAKIERNREAGFTLVEALVAIVILVFGLVAITNLLLVATGSGTAANVGTAAASLARQQMEDLKATPFDQLVVGGGVDSDVANYFRVTTVPGVGQVRTRWAIEPIDTPATDGQARFIRVRSEGIGAFTGPRTRADFSSFRVCTDQTPDICPPK